MAWLPRRWQGLQRYWQRAHQAVMATILASLPNRCLLCHQAIAPPGKGVCGFCLQACIYKGEVCLGCGQALVQCTDYCGRCQASTPTPIIAPMSYHSYLGPWVAAIKYQQQFAAITPLCRALMVRVQLLSHQGLIRPVQGLIPIPLHPLRLQQRGYNQARLIADELSSLSGIPVLTDLLYRTRDTPPQAGLNGQQRRQNVLGAFALQRRPEVFSVAIIDDVVTTASTAEQVAALLTAQGIVVQIWCLARAEAPGLSDL
ncbi:ComF family protein [Shewanella sp. NIFS-20-20]|uniref:ComF family protein n=1 Tax=Shewanella sp. NIFS-20-20 TaxID=2853806 RepID=UPI001C460B1A|nr:ComF family protein [Shewanella sp. NIFS-20-20]MBV7317291.1 ComF family protein [Shewanella sp. NIFS-20-20]